MEARLRSLKRDRVAIVADILEMACNGEVRTNIRYRAGLNSEMSDKYLGFMVKSKLVSWVLENNRMMLQATGKGMEFLRLCQEINELLETDNDDGQMP